MNSYRCDATGLSKQTDSMEDTYYTSLPDGALLAETIPAGDPTCPSGGGSCSYYYLSDGAGSVAAVTDTTGAVRNAYSYDPMGNATSTGNVPNAFTFNGWMFDSQTGYYYTGSGYYDPANGQSFGCSDRGRQDGPGAEDYCGEDEPEETFAGPLTYSISAMFRHVGYTYATARLLAHPNGKGSVTLTLVVNLRRFYAQGVRYYLYEFGPGGAVRTVLAQNAARPIRPVQGGTIALNLGTFSLPCTQTSFALDLTVVGQGTGQSTIHFLPLVRVTVPGSPQECD